MNEGLLGALLLAAGGGLGWLVLGSYKTGESINYYFIDSTGAGNPILYWLDLGLMTAAALMAVILGIAGIL